MLIESTINQGIAEVSPASACRREDNASAEISFAAISEQWISRLLTGAIRYDPAEIKIRWIVSEGVPSKRYLTILNEGRKNRFSSPAA